MLSITAGTDHENVDNDELPYRHVQYLGHGHSGIVEKVENVLTGALQARKTFHLVPMTRARSNELRKVFRNESKIIRKLGPHRHIIDLYATYTTTVAFCLVLQPVANRGDLGNFLKEYKAAVSDEKGAVLSNPRIPEMKLIIEKAFGCLSVALAFMHENKVRHKDIKPTNILIHDGRVIFTDFGYSFDSNAFSRSATDGKPGPSTPKYSAPEVLQHDPRDSRSDIFSLGCVFYELLSALIMAPDEAGSYSLIVSDLHKRIASWEVQSRLSSLPNLITQMTKLDPAERPCAIHTASEILRIPGLCCEGCGLTPIDPSEKCVKVGKCPKSFEKASTATTTLRTEDLHRSVASKLLPPNVKDHGSVFRSNGPLPSTRRLRFLDMVDSQPSESFSASESCKAHQGAGAFEALSEHQNNQLDVSITKDNRSSPVPFLEGSLYIDFSSQANMLNYEITASEPDTAIRPENHNMSSAPMILPRTRSEPLPHSFRRTREFNGVRKSSLDWSIFNSFSDGKLVPRRHHSQPLHLDFLPPSLGALQAGLHTGSSYQTPRHIIASPDTMESASRDSKYRRRTDKKKRAAFFVPGRVFRMKVSTKHVHTNEYEVSVQGIKTLLVVKTKGASSLCIPIQAPRNSDAANAGFIRNNFGLIHTSESPPSLEPGEFLTKAALRVVPVKDETLDSVSRVNYGEPDYVKHNYKVLNVGIVVKDQRKLIEKNMESAIDTRLVENALRHT